MNAKGFFDLCVPEKHFRPDNCFFTLQALRERNYRTIAINHEIKENAETKTENKKKKKKGGQRENTEIVPEPIKIDEAVLKVQRDEFHKLFKKFEEFTILNRLTVSFSDKDYYYKLTKSTNLKKYDIVAVLPTTKIAYMFVCTSVEADILSFDPTEKAPYRVERNVYNHLMKKGFYFEILYGPTIEDSTKFKNTQVMAHLYHTYGKSKNIIISSGAPSLVYLRNAYDIMNLGRLFGLNMQQAKDAVSRFGAELCRKAVGRCQGKSIVMIKSNTNEDCSVVELADSNDENMDSDEPEAKRLKNGEDDDDDVVIL